MYLRCNGLVLKYLSPTADGRILRKTKTHPSQVMPWQLNDFQRVADVAQSLSAEAKRMHRLKWNSIKAFHPLCLGNLFFN